MKYLAICAVLLAFAALPARSVGGAQPTPTPTPVAIAYDEVSRMVAPSSTPPPPGSFQADYQLALQGTSMTGTASEGASTPTPAPKHHGLGGLLNTVTNPMGNAGPPGPQGGPPGMMGGGGAMMNMMRYGHAVRYTFYWSKNWEREDDPVAKIATITKCPQHQIIHLDLAKQTYTIEDTSPHAASCDTSTTAQPMMGGRMNAQPGTADMTLKSTTQNLGPKTLENIPTTGSSRAFDMVMSNATGSCRDGQFGMTTVAYVSGIHKQRAYCPLSMPKFVASSAGEAISSGGCKPTMHSQTTGNPMANTSDFLEMYLLTTMHQGAASSGGSGFSQLLERGNVDWLYKPQADPLFEVPPGFTQAS